MCSVISCHTLISKDLSYQGNVLIAISECPLFVFVTACVCIFCEDFCCSDLTSYVITDCLLLTT